MPCGLTLSVLLKVSSWFHKENRRNTQKPTLWLPRRTSLKQWRKLDYMRICHIWQNIWTLETRYEHLKTTKRNNQICDPRARSKMWSKKKFQTYIPIPSLWKYFFPLRRPSNSLSSVDADRRQAMTLVSHRWQRWNDTEIFTASARSLFISFWSEFCLIINNKSDQSQQMYNASFEPQKRLTS